jgi:hypothetical protein
MLRSSRWTIKSSKQVLEERLCESAVNGLLLPIDIEPGVGSVVKSMGRDCKLPLSLLFLVSGPAPSGLLARTIGH